MDEAIRAMAQNMRAPGLRVKKLQGHSNVWEARASRDLRITFAMEPGRAVLRNFGHHDETLGNP